MSENRATMSPHLGFSPVPVGVTSRPALLCQPCSRVSTLKRATVRRATAETTGTPS
ncbi:hypothetical protein [Streptomyces erythrochromogenes]|uniref:hypothetical protein n=1 Tax=Streptomyces erythrochromogenes TaxID=285574 RepID=UPI0038657081|nr:hypothetical protein OG364_01835 [Streptomyces erythrochromogenes]